MKNNFKVLTFEKDGVELLKGILPKNKIFQIKKKLNKILLSDLKSIDNKLNYQNFKIKKKNIDFPKLKLNKKRILSGMFGLKIRLNKSLLTLLTNKKFISQLNEIIEQSIKKLHMPPMVRHSIPGNDFAQVPAHNDTAYNKHMKEFITAWIPLVKIDKKCQGLRFYIKNKDFRKKKTKKNKKELFWKQPVSTTNSYVNINQMNTGDAIIFNNKIIHSSLRNKSSKIKFSIDARYIFGKANTKKSYMNIKNKKIIIK